MQLRGEDIASRYGGEEFLLILPETGMEAALECAEWLLQATAALQLQHYGQTVDGLSISIGLSCIPSTALRLTC
jgi:diguanylate cyclase (GGDEF)-like protein